VLDDFLVVVSEMRVCHFQRLEYILRRKLAQQHAADSLDDQSKQREACVAIDIFVAGFEVQLFLPRRSAAAS
jgi:hypothetical protein